MKKFFGKSLPHLASLLIMLIVCAIYFAPQLKGYKLRQSDIEHHIGMSKEITDFREMYGSEPLWTGTPFAGMPAYQISTDNSNLISSIKNFILRIIPRPIGYVFFLMAGFYLFLMSFRVNPWLALIGSLAFGLSSIHVLYLGTGHNAKIHALSFIPPLLGGVLYAYRRNLFIGAVITAIFTCLHLSANHVQMTYYTLYLLIALVIVEFYRAQKSGQLKRFVKTSALLVLAGTLGLVPTLSNLLITYEYADHTIRGESELTIESGTYSGSGEEALNKDYITEYSLGFGESWSLIIPDAKGGAMSYLAEEEELIKEVPSQLQKAVAQQASYWGEQGFSGGALYLGASVFMLFLLGMFLLKDPIKWGIFAASMLALMLAWKYGNLTHFFIEHVPLFNKFRDTKMMLILPIMGVPALAILFLHKLFTEDVNKKRFLYVMAGTLLVMFALYVSPGTWLDFFSRAEYDQFEQQVAMYGNNPGFAAQFADFKESLRNIRIEIFKRDCLRSLLFMLTVCILVYLFMQEKLKKVPFLVFLALVIVIDLWAVDKRYLDNEKVRGEYKSWIDAYKYQNPFSATKADLQILTAETQRNPEINKKIEYALTNADIDKKLRTHQKENEREKIRFRTLNFNSNYRVLSLQKPFVNSRTSYYHKSLGGYHGAKLKLYQELIDFYIMNEYIQLVTLLQSEPNHSQVVSFMRDSIPILDMLNTRYIIYHPGAAPLINPNPFGNVWLADSLHIVQSADEEILALNNISPKTAVIRQKNLPSLNEPLTLDSSAHIILESYLPNHLTYNFSAEREQFAVFSEIFYEDGWNAYIDGNPAEYVRCNYALRGMAIPGGEHSIEFRFEPKTYYFGRNLTHAGSGLLILFIAGMLYFNFRKNNNSSV